MTNAGLCGTWLLCHNLTQPKKGILKFAGIGIIDYLCNISHGLNPVPTIRRNDVTNLLLQWGWGFPLKTGVFVTSLLLIDCLLNII